MQRLQRNPPLFSLYVYIPTAFFHKTDQLSWKSNQQPNKKLDFCPFFKLSCIEAPSFWLHPGVFSPPKHEKNMLLNLVEMIFFQKQSR